MRPEELRNFELTESQKMVRATARDFARKEIIPYVQQWEKEGRYSKDIVRKMGELGFLGVFIPEEYGGAGLDYLSYGIICEEIAYADWVCASIISVQNSLVENGILHFGTEEQKQRYLVPLAKGEMQASSALTEPSGGTDLAGLETTARRDGNYYILNGQKTFCSHASHTNVYFTLATVDKSLGRKGICAFLVENPSPGMEVTPLNMSTMKRGNIAQIFFDDVKVPKDDLLGELNRGFYHAMVTFEFERSTTGAGAGARRGLEELVNFCKKEKPNGKPLIENPKVRELLGDRAIEMELTWLAGWSAAWYFSQRDKVGSPPPEVMGLHGKSVSADRSKQLMDSLGLYGQLRPDSKWAKFDGRAETSWEVTRSTHPAGTIEANKIVLGGRGLGLPRVPAKFNKEIAEALADR